jgi:hypothetical protein
MSSLAFAYDWPLDEDNDPSNGVNQTTQHQINGTFGEFRHSSQGVPYDHFHSGVDIDAEANERVYSVEDATATCTAVGNISITIGNKRYVHVSNFQYDDENNQVPPHAWIASIDEDHLHFMESSNDTWINPLDDGLDPFDDYVLPEVWNVEVYRDTTAGGDSDEYASQKHEFTNDVIYGKVDLRARARDFRVAANGQSAGGNCSIYEIGYQAEDQDGTVRVGPNYHIVFDAKPDNDLIDVVYDAEVSNESTFYYWATNHETEDRYWNTRLKEGEDWKWCRCR